MVMYMYITIGLSNIDKLQLNELENFFQFKILKYRILMVKDQTVYYLYTANSYVVK